MFDRTRDWGDIEEMFAAGALSATDLHEVIRTMLGAEDERHARIDDVQRRAAERTS